MLYVYDATISFSLRLLKSEYRTSSVVGKDQSLPQLSPLHGDQRWFHHHRLGLLRSHLKSPPISQPHAAGAGSTQAQSEPTEQSSDLATSDIAGDSSDLGSTEFSDEFTDDFTADAGSADPGYSEEPPFQDDTSAGSDVANVGSSTGDAIGQAVGNHLGKLLGQGISDLFGRR